MSIVGPCKKGKKQQDTFTCTKSAVASAKNKENTCITMNKGELSEKITDYFPKSPTSEISVKVSLDTLDKECSGSALSTVENAVQGVKDDINVTETQILSVNRQVEKKTSDTCSPEKHKKSVSLKASDTKVTKSTKGQKSKQSKTRSKSVDAANRSTSNSSKKKTVPQNTLLTDYYPVRRSSRKTKAQIEKEEANKQEEAILSGKEDGLEVKEIESKGRGVFATKAFKRGEFVVEYAGDLIDLNEANLRDEEYSEDPSKGCYMYYFKFKNRSYCIDATSESGKLGRLVNHSKQGNCTTKLIGIGDRPYLVLTAADDIDAGTELLYDYGDRSKASIESHPWLKS